jgi:hypothetical protein
LDWGLLGGVEWPQPLVNPEASRGSGELTPPLLQNVIDILEYSNKKRVQELKTELLEWEELEKLKLKRKKLWCELLGPHP